MSDERPVVSVLSPRVVTATAHGLTWVLTWSDGIARAECLDAAGAVRAAVTVSCPDAPPSPAQPEADVRTVPGTDVYKGPR